MQADAGRAKVCRTSGGGWLVLAVLLCVLGVGAQGQIIRAESGLQGEEIIAVEGGDKAYILDGPSKGPQEITVLDTATDTAVATIRLDEYRLSHLAAVPGKAYVTTTGGKVVVIDTARDVVVGKVTVGKSADQIVAGGGRVYVLNVAENAVSIIETGTDTVTATVAVGEEPCWLAYADGRVYVACAKSSSLYVLDGEGGAPVAVIRVAVEPRCVVVGDGKGYVANSRSDAISVVDLDTNTLVATVRVGSNPRYVAVGDGEAYVANWDSEDISVIDTMTNALVGTVKLGCPARQVLVVGGVVYAMCSSYTAVIDSANHTVMCRISRGGKGMAALQGKLYIVDDGVSGLVVLDTARVVSSTIQVNERGLIDIAVVLGKAYCTSTGDDAVYVLDVAKEELVSTIRVEGPSLAVSANGKVYVSCPEHDAIVVVDAATDTVLQTIAVVEPRRMLADGNSVFVASESEAPVLCLINAVTDSVEATIPVPELNTVDAVEGPRGMAFTAGKLYVLDEDEVGLRIIDVGERVVLPSIREHGRAVVIVDGKTYVASAAAPRVSVIDTANCVLMAVIDLGVQNYAVALAAVGANLYFSNNRGVYLIDTSADTAPSIVWTARTFMAPGTDLAVMGGMLYAALGDGTVGVLDTNTGTWLGRIPVGESGKLKRIVIADGKAIVVHGGSGSVTFIPVGEE